MNALPAQLIQSFKESPPGKEEALAFEIASRNAKTLETLIHLFDIGRRIDVRSRALWDFSVNVATLCEERCVILAVKRLFDLARKFPGFESKREHRSGLADFISRFRFDQMQKLASMFGACHWSIVWIMRCKLNDVPSTDQDLARFCHGPFWLETMKLCIRDSCRGFCNHCPLSELDKSVLGDILCKLHCSPVYNSRNGSIVGWLDANGVSGDDLMDLAKHHYLDDQDGMRECLLPDDIVALTTFGFIPHLSSFSDAHWWPKTYHEYRIYVSDKGKLTTCSSNIKLVAWLQRCVAKRVNKAVNNLHLAKLILEFIFRLV